MLRKLRSYAAGTFGFDDRNLRVNDAGSDALRVTSTEIIDDSKPPFLELLLALKQHSEAFIRAQADLLTVSYPPYLDDK
jgi:hypothetical protein